MYIKLYDKQKKLPVDAVKMLHFSYMGYSEPEL